MSSLRESGVWKGWPYPEHDNRKRKDRADDMEAVAVELLADQERRKVERRQGEDERPPAHLEKEEKSQGQDRQRRQERKGENSGRTLKGRFPSRHLTQRDPQATNMNQI